MTGYQRRLAVAEHTLPASGLTQVFDLYAPKALECFAVDLRFVDRPILFILSFFLLFGFGRRFRHLLRSGLFVLGRIDLVRREHIPKADGVFQQVFHYRNHVLHAFDSNAVESEAVRLLALPEEVGKEVVQHVPVSVETQEVLCVFCFGGSQIRRAVAFQPCDYADFTRLLVPDDQNILVFLFLFHT